MVPLVNFPIAGTELLGSSLSNNTCVGTVSTLVLAALKDNSAPKYSNTFAGHVGTVEPKVPVGL